MSDKKNSHYDILDMIFEDKYSKKYYFLMIKDNNNLQYLEIKSKYNENNEKYEIKNFFESENDLKKFTDIIKGQILFSGCVINKYIDNHNTDCLYLYFRKEGNCLIINLLNRKIIENIKINKYIKSILNWNNKNLILLSDESFYIFDTRNNQIISKYSNFSRKEPFLKSIKTFFSIKNNFYCIFVAEENIHFYISI